MKKYFTTLCFTLLSVFIFAQEKQIPVIKIFLEDGENGKNVANAKVTLEGFELPAIIAKYNVEEKNYYFNEIPSGYNTIMVYHKKYNEKGFQNINGLPNELKFRLFDPVKVFYSFEFFWYHYPPHKSYVEDPYKISISIDNDMNYNDLRGYIAKKIKSLNLEIELVNPLWEESKTAINSFTFPEQKEAYPLLNLKKKDEIDSEYIFPLKSGVSTIFPDRNYSNKPKDICFMVRKKDGSKFKRFNDPIIKRLKEENLNVSTIVLNKTAGYFDKNKLDKRDRLNKKFNIKHNIDSSKVFFYDMSIYKKQPKIFFWKHRKPRTIIIEPGQFPQLPIFFLIPNDDLDIPEYRPNTERVDFQKIPVQDKAIGIGIVDQYEYYLHADLKHED